MISRRDVFGTAVSSACLGAVALSGTRDARSATPAPDSMLARAAQLLRAGPLMNLERAYEVMAEEGLDGLVLCLPTNVFHVTGYWDHVSVMHDAPESYVLLSHDSRQAPGLVMSQFLYYYSFADHPLESPLQVYLFTGWNSRVGESSAEAAAKSAEPKPRPPFVFPDAGGSPLREFERRRLAKNDAALRARPLAAGPEFALMRAVREMGLDRGRIGYDHAAVAANYEHAGMKARLAYADRPLRRIRMIKSAREIEMMRLVARANADATLAAVRTARAGATHAELRAVFAAECATRGTSALQMQIDTMVAETAHQAFEEGSAFAVDSVSVGLRYWGDYGRTVFVGEPSRIMKRATDAIALGWDAVRERLRPGLRYSDIRKIGTDALKKAGFDFDVAFTPHSVGLAHTDEPGVRRPDGYWVKDDIVLQPNMILSVDFPVRQTGIGGSAHLEDLTLITRDGAVPINDLGDRTILV